MDNNEIIRLLALQDDYQPTAEAPEENSFCAAEKPQDFFPPTVDDPDDNGTSPAGRIFEPFNKNRLEWEAFDRSKSCENDQAIADKLKELNSDVEESSGFNFNNSMVDSPGKTMSMNRTFLFQEGVDPRFQRLDDLTMLYRMEEGLANNMLTMINDGASKEFSRCIGQSEEEPEGQRFRREAINHCALKQALTETTDATARSCNLVKLVVEPYEVEADFANLDFPEELGDNLWQEDVTRSRWTSRRDVEANDTLESFFSICQEPNVLEVDFLSQYLGLETESVHDWFRGKQKRVKHLFVTRKLPQGNSVRMLDHRMRQSLHDIFPPRLSISR
ncbi:hypothetical protein JOL62DRAFT_559369 [Phyllosticta paracitricarpa]|uniref:Homeobox domain-containing protein n=2 Tax=Phyllosticta TaxID=121621 RepID=A0ABR1M4P4_9PEZI